MNLELRKGPPPRPRFRHGSLPGFSQLGDWVWLFGRSPRALPKAFGTAGRPPPSRLLACAGCPHAAAAGLCWLRGCRLVRHSWLPPTRLRCWLVLAPPTPSRRPSKDRQKSGRRRLRAALGGSRRHPLAHGGSDGGARWLIATGSQHLYLAHNIYCIYHLPMDY